jgi:hypothetical protein
MFWSLSSDIKALGKPNRKYKFHDTCMLKAKDEKEENNSQAKEK